MAIEPEHILAGSMCTLLVLGMCAQVGIAAGGAVGRATKPIVLLALLVLVCVVGMVGLWGTLELEDTRSNWKTAAESRMHATDDE